MNFSGMSWSVELNVTSKRPKSDSYAIPKKIKGDFSCPQCGKKYSFKGTLTRHMRFECGRKPGFQCPVCSKPFTRNDTLNQHIKIIHPQAATFFNLPSRSAT